MRFAFDEDQLAFRDAVRDLLAKACGPEVVRAAWPEGVGPSGARAGDGSRADVGAVAQVWQDLAQMGVLGVGVSEANGGLGLGALDWVLLAEETGYAALPHPFVETACVVAPLLDGTGDPHGVLPALLDGSRQAVAVPLGTAVVPWARSAPYLVRLAPEPSGGPWVARHLTLPAPGSEPVEPVESVDGARGAEVLAPGATGDAFGAPAAAARAFDHGALGSAAQLVGLGRRMLDLTVAYVCERKQFGVAIGSQQAVKHHLADAAMKLRFAAPAVYAAAWSVATDAPTAARDVSTAKALASDAARFTARQALQCHGAIGYTVEYDLHLYLKRSEALVRAWGDASWHRRRVAAALGI